MRRDRRVSLYLMWNKLLENMIMVTVLVIIMVISYEHYSWTLFITKIMFPSWGTRTLVPSVWGKLDTCRLYYDDVTLSKIGF